MVMPTAMWQPVEQCQVEVLYAQCRSLGIHATQRYAQQEDGMFRCVCRAVILDAR